MEHSFNDKCNCGCDKVFLKNIKETCNPKKQKTKYRKEKDIFNSLNSNNKLYKYKIKDKKK